MLLLLLACLHHGSAGGAGAADARETCTPAAPVGWDGRRAYAERTQEWGLDGVQGGRFVSGDLDGDRYPDLLVTEVFSNARDDLAAGVRYHHLLLNRADGQGGRTFVDATLESGVLTNRAGGTGTSSNVHVLGDVDNDGDLDLFAGRYVDAGAGDATGDCSEVYLNDGAAHFTLAPPSDICIRGGYPTAGASFTDYDHDGILDLWVTGWYVRYGDAEGAQDHLYRGSGDGTFVDVTDAVGLTLKDGKAGMGARDVRRPAYGATACDVNGDALPDLLASNYGRSWNQLWRNEGGRFTEIGEAAGFASDTDLTYADNEFYACWCAAHGPCAPAPTRACPAGRYADYWEAGVDDQPWRLNGNSFTTVCSDIDNDGDADLYTAEIVHDWAGESADPTQLLLNDGAARFTRVPNAAVGLARPRVGDRWNEGDIMAAFVDFDNDGWKDILLLSSDYEDTHLWLWRQVSPGQFRDVSEATGLNQPWPAGMTVADFDQDGDLDVIAGSSTARSGTPWTDRRAHFYENALGGGNWVQVDGLPPGTRVTVEAGGITQTQEVSGGYGHFGVQNDTTLHFGLGGACLVDTLTATLPGGEQVVLRGKAGNQRITVSR